MKKFFSNQYKIVLSIVVVLSAMLFLPSCNSSDSSSDFNIKADSDTNFYTSGRDLMTYYDGKLIVEEYNLLVNDSDDNFTDIYSTNGKEHISTPEKSQVVNDKMVYIEQDKLYYKTINTDNQLLIADNCNQFHYNGNKIVYESGNDLFVAEITSEEKVNNQKLHTLNEEGVFHLQLNENKLYVSTYMLYSEDFISKYNFYIFDVDKMSMVDSCYCTMSGSPENMSVCNGDFIFNHRDSSTIFKVDFENNNLIRLLEHESIVALTSNGEKVYFVAEKTEWKLVTKTVDVETNGLWELDIATGDIKKISDECVIYDILATDNYVYCYTIEYTNPRGVSNLDIKGYKLQQIPIN